MSNNYINFPIQEAIFEIKFKDNIKWDFTVPGILFEKIKNKFPKKKNIIEGMVEFKFNQKENVEPIQNYKKNEIPQFLNEKQNIFVIIKKNQISIHHLRPYTSWTNYKKLIEFVYSEYVKTIKETVKQEIEAKDISRIGLRYINRIEIPNDDFKLENYFNFKPTIIDDEKLLAAFIVGNIYKFNNNLIKIQLTTQEKTADKQVFILDTDFYTTDLKENINDWQTKAHDKIEKYFNQSLTEETLKLFK